MSNELVNIEDSDLEFTRAKRKELVAAITEKGMPTETKDRLTLLAALDGMDKAALSKKKIKSDEGVSDKNVQAIETITKLFADARLKNMSKVVGSLEASIPVLREDLPLPVLVPGELDEQSDSEDYEAFTHRTNM
jgi:hypothetical protein